MARFHYRVDWAARQVTKGGQCGYIDPDTGAFKCFRKLGVKLPPAPVEYDLSKKHTKVLLLWLAQTRTGYDAVVFHDGNFMSMGADRLKAELATREHVPTGEEARKIRQRKAFEKRHR